MSARRDSPPDPTATASRGFIYFCEERLRYLSGTRAWYFFCPFILGVLVLESFLPPISGLSAWRSWLPLVAYVLIFPPAWRALLIRAGWWRRRLE